MIPAIFAALAREEIEAARGRLSREAVFRLCLGVFALLALGFAVALGIVALTQWQGILVALGTATGVSVLVCLVVWGLMIQSRRRARRAAAARRISQVRALRLALIEAAPFVRNAPLIAFGAALFAGLNMGRKDEDAE